MNFAFLGLGITFFGLSFVFFAQARKAVDGKAERVSRLAGALLSVGGVAFIIAGTLHTLTGTGT